MKRMLKRTLFVLTICGILFLTNFTYAANIVEIAVDQRNIPCLLDDTGQVWTFHKQLSPSSAKPYKLGNLNHIKKIAPNIAIDDKGQVFTWHFNSIKSNYGDEVGEDEEEFVYTSPQRVEGLHGVTQIASDNGIYFVAVVDGKDIVDWLEWVSAGSDTASRGKIRKVVARAGVKSIAALWSPKARVINMRNALMAPPESSLVALFDDGAVIGWGIQPTGMSSRGIEWKEIILTQAPGATGIAMNGEYTVILSANGVPQFWGGCGVKDRKGQPYPPGNIGAVKGTVNDVKGMALISFSDHYNPDVFITSDGSVWLAYAPAPPGMLGKDCYQINEKKGQFWQMPAGKAPAVQVAARNSIFMLDADHKLWMISDSLRDTKFTELNVNLTE